MTTYNSQFVVIPKRFCGLRVLLVELDESSLAHHVYILSQNSYRVTTTHEVATALSKILNGESYDCVLIDADISEMDMVDFLHQTFKHQPQLSIIMMASHNIHMRLFEETLQNEAVLCLPKPCDPWDICNIWKHVRRNRILFEGGDYSNGESNEENQEPNILKGVDSVINQSTTINRTMTNNMLSSGRTKKGLDINSQEHGAMLKPLTYEELWSSKYDQEHFYETKVKENISSGTMKNMDKGKRPVEYKRTNDQVVEDDIYRKKQKYIKTRISWTSELHSKFVEAVNTLGNQKVYPTAILEVMKVPGLTRSQVASHLQKYQEHQRSIKKTTLLHEKQEGNNSEVESNAYKRHGQSTTSDNYASTLPSSTIDQPLNLNAGGISYMTFDNIKALLQGILTLPLPQPTTTINNSISDQTTNHNFGNLLHPSMVETHMITTSGLLDQNTYSYGKRIEVVQITSYGYGSATRALDNTVETLKMEPADATSFANGFVGENFDGGSGSIFSETPAPLDCSGMKTEPWVTGLSVAVRAAKYNPEMCEISNLGMTNFGGGDNLFLNFPHTMTPDHARHSINPNFSNLFVGHAGIGSVDVSLPCLLGEENNRQEQTQPPFNSTIVPVDGFEGRVIESDLFPNIGECNIEMTVNILDELDPYLRNGPW